MSQQATRGDEPASIMRGMDAPEPRDTRTELAELRRRAYGPDGDIHSDAAAVARLKELEELHRRTDDVPTASASAATSASVAVLALPPTIAESRTVGPDAEGPADLAAARVAAPPARHAPWRRRLLLCVIVAGVALIGFGLGVSLPRLFTAGPTATVEPIEQEGLTPDFLGARGLAFFGLDPDSMVAYEMFGESRAWSGVNRSGARCLFIAVKGIWMDGGCTPLGLPPTAEYVNNEPAEVAGDPPVRNVVRYVQRTDGLIDVWVASAPGPDS